MEISTALYCTKQIISLAVILQTIELFHIRQSFSDQGVWRWGNLKVEFEIFSKLTQKFLAFTLKYENFLVLLALRLIAAVCLIFYSNAFLFLYLLISTLLISLRWRGTFNGGSDYMTIIVLSALTFNSFFSSPFENTLSEKVSLAAIWYITIQICSSYFISGIVKIRRSNWRNGAALRGFMASTIYNDNSASRLISDNKIISIILSWAIIIFEVGFVVALLNPLLCVGFIIFALAFHLANFYFFGLNRFIFAWTSCYPALLFCSN